MKNITEPTIVQLEFLTCQKCPFFEKGPVTSTDGFDRMEDWLCGKKKNKVISGGVEWHEEDKIPVPDWCPIRVKTETK